MKRLSIAVAVFATLAQSACSTSPSDFRITSLGDPRPEITLLPGDKVSVFVWKGTGPTPHEIGPDGRFSMHLIGDVDAAGRTPTELAAEIESKLSQHLSEPDVFVIPHRQLGSNADAISVHGAVVNPAALDYQNGMTVLDAMIKVGGLTSDAYGNGTVLIRRDTLGETEYRIRLDDLVREGRIAADRPLRPGDTLIIPNG